jgi:hypothetical protein
VPCSTARCPVAAGVERIANRLITHPSGEHGIDNWLDGFRA